MPELDLGKLLDLERWFDPFPSEPSPIYFVLLGIYVVAAAALAGLRYYWIPRRFASHRLLKELSRRSSEVVLGLLLLGTAAALSRLTGIPYFSMRIWLLLDVLAIVGVIVFGVYYGVARLPARVAAFDAEELKRRYMRPRPRQAGARAQSRGRVQRRARRR